MLFVSFSCSNAFFFSPAVSFFILTLNQGCGLPERFGTFLFVFFGAFSTLRLLSEASFTCSEKLSFSLVPGMWTFTLEGLLALKISFSLLPFPFSLWSITCTWLLCSFLLLRLLRLLLLPPDSSKIPELLPCSDGTAN